MKCTENNLPSSIPKASLVEKIQINTEKHFIQLLELKKKKTKQEVFLNNNLANKLKISSFLVI